MTDVDCTTQVNGTSLSCPLLAGVVACMIDAQPSFGVQQMRARLLRTGHFFKANGFTDPLFVEGWGIPDADEAAFDCNDNGIDDPTDIALGTSTDCNGNGLPDECDLADGISTDADMDGRLDECLPPNLDRAPGPPGGAGSIRAPLVAAPPSPRVGQSLRLVFELPGGASKALSVLVIRRGTEVVGLLPGGLLGPAEVGEIVAELPADPGLAGQEFGLTVEFFDPTSRVVVARSVERSIVVRP